MNGNTRIEVRRGKNESSSALIRRFTRRAQSLNLVREVRGGRYWQRKASKNTGHKRALIALARRTRYHELVKLGKIDPSANRRGRNAKN